MTKEIIGEKDFNREIVKVNEEDLTTAQQNSVMRAWCQNNRCEAKCFKQKGMVCEDIRGVKGCRNHVHKKVVCQDILGFDIIDNTKPSPSIIGGTKWK